MQEISNAIDSTNGTHRTIEALSEHVGYMYGVRFSCLACADQLSTAWLVLVTFKMNNLLT